MSQPTNMAVEETKHNNPNAMEEKKEPIKVIPPCPGKRRINDGTWWTPIGRKPEHITYCEYCMANNHFNIKETVIQPYPQNACNCDCDCVRNPDCLTCDNISVDIRLKNGDICRRLSENDPSFHKYLSQTTKNVNGGFMLVNVPSASEYTIDINVNNTELPLIWYTVESAKIGDKQIGDARMVYWQVGSHISTVVTTKNEPLFLICPTQREQTEGIKYNVAISDHIIKLKIQKYHKAAKNDMSSAYVMGLNASYSNQREFDKTGDEITFTIQLICDQTEDEKYKANFEYYQTVRKNEKIEIRKNLKHQVDNHKYYDKVIEDYVTLRDSAIKSIQEMKKKLNEYADIRDSDNADDDADG